MVDVGMGTVCQVSRIFYMNGKEALGSWGTTTRDDIKKVFPNEHWNLKKIITATYRPFQGADSREVIEALRKNSHQHPRMLSM